MAERVRKEPDRHGTRHHARLCGEDPGSAASHREKTPTVHDGTVDEFQAPREDRDSYKRANHGRADALLGHVGWYSDRKQAIGKTLGRVQCREGAEAKNEVFGKRRERLSCSCAKRLVHWSH